MRNIHKVIIELIKTTDRIELKELLGETLNILSDGFKNPNDYWWLLHENLMDIIDIKNMTNNDLEVLSIFTTKSVEELKELANN